MKNWIVAVAVILAAATVSFADDWTDSVRLGNILNIINPGFDRFAAPGVPMIAAPNTLRAPYGDRGVAVLIEGVPAATLDNPLTTDEQVLLKRDSRAFFDIFEEFLRKDDPRQPGADELSQIEAGFNYLQLEALDMEAYESLEGMRYRFAAANQAVRLLSAADDNGSFDPVLSELRVIVDRLKGKLPITELAYGEIHQRLMVKARQLGIDVRSLDHHALSRLSEQVQQLSEQARRQLESEMHPNTGNQ